MFSNLSTFRENANNEESDQTGLLGGGGWGGRLLMDQSNPCFYTKVILQSLTWPQDQIYFPMSVLSHLRVLKPYFCTIFFQRDTSCVTIANETGGKYESGRVASPESVPSNKNGIHSTHL